MEVTYLLDLFTFMPYCSLRARVEILDVRETAEFAIVLSSLLKVMVEHDIMKLLLVLD